ncbi:MAG: hypothetical protein IEMM0002_1203 [bacterium]|nr:MAG: hypothetical protein IEMM0002_1203 [bacterium]
MNKLLIALLAFWAFAAVSCRSSEVKPSEPVQFEKEISSEKLNKAITVLATQVYNNLEKSDQEERSVVVTTFVDVDSLESGGRFGRYISEMLVYVLYKLKFRLFEIRQAEEIMVIRKGGEFQLTRESEKLLDKYSSDAVIVGTYILVDNDLTLTLRMLDRETSRIISVAAISLNLADDPFLLRLLTKERSSPESTDTAEALGSIELREPVMEEVDTTAKQLSLKIDKMSRDIAGGMKGGGAGGKKLLLVSTFVDLDKLNRTNTFGRYIAEQLMGNLSERGFRVIELRAAKELMVLPNIGEMALTRNLEEMMNKYEADAIVLGTYKNLGDAVTVHSRMVIGENQEVVSVASMRIKVDENDRFMKSLFENELDRISMQNEVEGF